jgi:ribose-phosphate pyrophosphokinase
MKEANLIVLSGTSNAPLAQEVAKTLDTQLTKVDIKRFSDGEISIRILENVRGTDAFVIQSTSAPANDNLMEVMLLVDALRRASARRITVVIPYYGYGRQDRKVEPRVPISAKVVAGMLEGVGIKRLLTMDMHADQIQGFFENPVDHLYAAPVLINYLKTKQLKEPVMVSPDSGGAERARFFAKQMNASLAIVDKRREKANESEVMNVIGEIDGKSCILIDDMIDTAGTICKAATALKEKGAADVFAAATHGVLSGEAINRIEESPISELVITNSIPIPAEKQLKKIKVLSVASLIGKAIQRIHEERSVSSLFL